MNDLSASPVWLRRMGQGPRQVLAVHCSLAHSGEWRGIADHLGSDLTITAFDLPGHGRAPDYDRAEDIGDQAVGMGRQALESISGQVDLIGHSFGGVLALRLAIENPDRVRSLTLIEPTLYAAAIRADLPEVAELTAMMRPMIEALAAGEQEQAARVFTRDWGTGEPWERLPETQRAYITARIGLILSAEPVLREDTGQVLNRLDQVTCPVLLMQGGDSPAIVGAILTQMEEALADTTRVTVPGARHMLPVTHAAEVAAAIGAFISRE